MVLEARNDVVKGTFCSRIMVGELINGDYIPIVRKCHYLEQRRCNNFHGIHEAPSYKDVIVELGINLDINEGFLSYDRDGNILI